MRPSPIDGAGRFGRKWKTAWSDSFLSARKIRSGRRWPTLRRSLPGTPTQPMDHSAINLSQNAHPFVSRELSPGYFSIKKLFYGSARKRLGRMVQRKSIIPWRSQSFRFLTNPSCSSNLQPPKCLPWNHARGHGVSLPEKNLEPREAESAPQIHPSALVSDSVIGLYSDIGAHWTVIESRLDDYSYLAGTDGMVIYTDIWMKSLFH